MGTGTARLPYAKQVVRALDEEFFLISEVAEICAMTCASVKRLTRDPNYPELAPSAYYEESTGRRIGLYTAEDVEKFQDHYERPGKNGSGRPRQWAREQGQERTRLQDLQRYYRKRVALLQEQGRDHLGAQAKLDKICAKLAAQVPLT